MKVTGLGRNAALAYANRPLVIHNGELVDSLARGDIRGSAHSCDRATGHANRERDCEPQVLDRARRRAGLS